MDQKKIIYADDLLGVIREDMSIRGAAYAAVVKHINVAPAADAAPVVHGRWMWEGRFKACSVCGTHIDMEDTLGASFWNYCPNCGAKMDMPIITDDAAAALERMGANVHGGE